MLEERSLARLARASEYHGGKLLDGLPNDRLHGSFDISIRHRDLLRVFLHFECKIASIILGYPVIQILENPWGIKRMPAAIVFDFAKLLSD